MMGGLIMAHGDDHGLRVPPRLAAVQVVVLVVRDEDGSVSDAARDLVAALGAAGVRAKLDDRVSTPFGRRATDWELKGVPVRVEVGPRDLAEGQVTVVRRDQQGKTPVAIAELARRVPDLLSDIQTAMYDQALALRESRTVDVATVADAAAAATTGFARIPWAALADGGVAELARDAVTVRCLVTADGGVPVSVDDPDLVAVVARAY
jgi:prolyl-tRNA synthetase